MTRLRPPRGLRVHYAFRIFRSTEHLGQTVWQPFCGISNIGKIRMSTILSEVTCLNCQNRLITERRRLGLSRQINRVRREGKWSQTK